MNTEYGLSREDVNVYFKSEYDYTMTGFTASVNRTLINADAEYEVLIYFKNPSDIIHLKLPQYTSTFLSGSSISYYSKERFKEPEIIGTDLEEIVKNGKLRVYREDMDCWVYQYKGCLYWIVGNNFYFEKDGSTYIQYQLWTTQPEKLPQKRLEKGWLWDN